MPNRIVETIDEFVKILFVQEDFVFHILTFLKSPLTLGYNVILVGQPLDLSL